MTGSRPVEEQADRGDAGRRYGALPVTAALAAVSGLAFHRVFGWGPVIPVTAVAAVVPTILSGLLSGPRQKRPWPLWISLVLTVVGWLAVCALTLFRDRVGDGSVFRAIVSGLRNAWQSILTALLPAPDRPELLVLVSAVVWLVAFAGAETALRTGLRGAPALPALGGVGIALLLGVDGPGSNAPIVVALVLLFGALVLIRTPGMGVRRLLVGVPIALVLGLLALAAGPYVPVRGQAYNPRKHVQAPPPQTRDSVSPLDRISAWLYRPDQPMFTVRSSRPENWRLAVLDRFDGLDWTASGRFVPTGSQVPPASDAIKGRTETVQQRFTIQELPGVWVPAADRVRSIDGLPVTVDETSGVVAAGQDLRSGQTYKVTSAVPDWTTDQLAAAVPAQDAEAKAALAVPWGPGATKEPVELAEFRQMARQAVQNALSPIQQAAALASWFSGQGRYDVTARPGHTYSQLAWFLCQAPVKGKCASQMRGTPEQFATAYAIMARSLGLPTRVVVGFRPGTDRGDGLRQVDAGDVLAWPEVKFAGLGWVPFNPTPAQAGANKSDAIAAGDTQQKVEALQKTATTGASAGGGAKTPPPKPTAKKAVQHSAAPLWLYATAALGVLVVCYILAVLAVPALRRRRRRSGPTPAHRVAGAWHQVVERLGEVGLSGVRTRTAHEVVDFATRTVGESAAGPLGRLADLVNHSRYADAPVDPRAAVEAWQHSDQIGRLVTRHTGLARRVRNRLHPRALRR